MVDGLTVPDLRALARESRFSRRGAAVLVVSINFTRPAVSYHRRVDTPFPNNSLDMRRPAAGLVHSPFF